MNKRYPIIFSKGFTISQHNIETDQREAYDILTSKKMHAYTRVCEKDGLFTFTQHRITCGYCDESQPAYTHIIRGYTEMSLKVLPDLAEAFVSQSGSLFNEGLTNSLELYSPLNEHCIYTCPHCGETMKHESKTETIIADLSIDDGVIKISCGFTVCEEALFDIREPRFLKRPVQTVFKYSDAISEMACETIEFNFKTNKVCSSMFFNESTIEIQIDQISEKSTALSKYISEVPVFRKNIKKAFESLWTKGMSFPLQENEITIDRLILATKYQGFDKSFYENIPLNNYGGFDPEFEEIASLLKTPESLPEVFERYHLSQCNGDIKRLFFERPYLLFYPHEIKKLYDILGDALKFLLVSNIAVDILTLFHKYPGCFIFVEDLATELDPYQAVIEIDRKLHKNLPYIFRYACVSDKEKERQRLIWKEMYEEFDVGIFGTIESRSNEKILRRFDYPIRALTCLQMPVRSVGGFVFKTPRTTSEVARIENDVSVNLMKIESPIVGIERNGKYVGFLVIGKPATCTKIEVAYSVQDKKVSFLKEAIETFCSQNNFKIRLEPITHEDD